MRISTGHNTVRLIWALGVFLPAAVQQKVCAWPVADEAQGRESITPFASESSEERSDHKTKPPLTMAAMLPDVVAPRWPNHTHLTAVQRARPLPASAWMANSGDDDQQPQVAKVDSIFAAVWSYRLVPLLEPVAGLGEPESNRTLRMVFQTAILKTGPPRS